MKKQFFYTVLFTAIFGCSLLVAQKKDSLSKTPVVINDPLNTPESGIAVSPSTLRFNAKPGTSQVKTIKITNDTKRKISFQVSFQDVGTDKAGKQEIAVNSQFKHSLSKYLIVSPMFIELEAHESKVITVTADIPMGDSVSIALWTTLVIDQMRERGKLEVPNANNSTIGLGINAGIGFGVNVYQNPPNVSVNNVEITQLLFEKAGAANKMVNTLTMGVKNTGDGIGYCLYYIELTNLITGKQTKLKVKQFGILPGYSKEIKFDLPKELSKGKYSALAVLDFGDKDVLQTAEIDFAIE